MSYTSTHTHTHGHIHEVSVVQHCLAYAWDAMLHIFRHFMHTRYIHYQKQLKPILFHFCLNSFRTGHKQHQTIYTNSIRRLYRIEICGLVCVRVNAIGRFSIWIVRVFGRSALRRARIFPRLIGAFTRINATINFLSCPRGHLLRRNEGERGRMRTENNFRLLRIRSNVLNTGQIKNSNHGNVFFLSLDLSVTSFWFSVSCCNVSGPTVCF